MTRRFGAWLVAGAIAAGLGCETKGGQFAKDMGMAAGEGALSGFADYVSYRQENQWGQSWATSGRGVGSESPVLSRAAREKQDCSAVPDESALYVGDVLHNPASFVATIDGSIDGPAAREIAKAGLRVPQKGGAIGILKTTAGRYARFVLEWGDQPKLHGLTVYDATGEATLRFDVPMPLAPHALVNLDKGESEGFDLLYGPDPDGRPTLAAGEGAALSFPRASLCKTTRS
jgi:hypothetical protein